MRRVKIRYFLSKIVKIRAKSRKMRWEPTSHFLPLCYNAILLLVHLLLENTRVSSYMMKIIHNGFDQCLAVLESMIDDANNWQECGWLYIFQKLQLITELWSTSCEPFDIITGSFMVKAHLSACGEFVTIMSLMENQWRARWTIVLQNIKFHDFTVLFSLYFWIKFSLYTGCFFTGQP